MDDWSSNGTAVGAPSCLHVLASVRAAPQMQPRRLPRAKIRAAALLAQLAFAAAQVNRASVLRNLYEVTGGANWSRSDNWLQGDPCSYTAPWASSSRYDCVTQAFVAERQPVCCQQLDGALQVGQRLDLADNGLRHAAGRARDAHGAPAARARRQPAVGRAHRDRQAGEPAGAVAPVQPAERRAAQAEPREARAGAVVVPVSYQPLRLRRRAPPNRACNASALAWTSASSYLPAPGRRARATTARGPTPAPSSSRRRRAAAPAASASTAVTTVVALVVVAISLVVLREVWRLATGGGAPAQEGRRGRGRAGDGDASAARASPTSPTSSAEANHSPRRRRNAPRQHAPSGGAAEAQRREQQAQRGRVAR